MHWTNIRLIFSREVLDQLRDRRTLFMIAALPLVLYPLLGVLSFQIAQFQRESMSTVLVVGADRLDGLESVPKLFRETGFAPELLGDPTMADRLTVDFVLELTGDSSELKARARRAVLAGEYDVAIYFPPDFTEQLEALSATAGSAADVPNPEVFYSTSSETSSLAFERVQGILRRWNERIGQENLEAAGISVTAASPLEVASADVSAESGRGGERFWTVILPILLVLWAMTGAFYPATDLCAGEKERGTLETLLCSPVKRGEIVLGKVLTIMLISMVTATLNLASMGLTGWLVLSRIEQFEAPPALAAVWLGLALVPVSAFFAATCLALAAFAKSAREGQYYLMPLMLVTMPLALLPMVPGVELNLGNSLIPVTGIVLLLRALLEGSYTVALQFGPLVIATTLACCVLAMRWAVDQFNSESVLFGESERLDLGLWVRRLWADRQPTPGAAAAVVCGLTILLVKFFMSLGWGSSTEVPSLVRSSLLLQLGAIALPAVLMALFFTTSVRKTLLVKRPRWMCLVAAPLLAVLLQPTMLVLQAGVVKLYPVNKATEEALESLFVDVPGWQLFLLIALLPAVCEELAFRGFILSGFRHLGHKWRAIIYSALFFGVSHAVFQQSILAALVGVVLGFLAVQTGSILPAMLFHAVYNGMALASNALATRWADGGPALFPFLVRVEDDSIAYGWPVVVVSAILAVLVLRWFHRLPHWKSHEEDHLETIAQAARLPEEAE